MALNKLKIGVAGSGAMGSGIAQVAATSGHKVCLYDNNPVSLQKAKDNLEASLKKLVEKQKITQEKSLTISGNIEFISSTSGFKDCGLVIEAIIENLEIKKALFTELETIVSSECILASNTSSLSITSIASACKKPSRVIGIHFFNPATLMPLVEIIPGIATDTGIVTQSKELVDGWGKTTVIARDTPGFIVNRVARPFYSEALRIYDEGIADMPTIDWAMKEIGGFRMGPFELMDMIGHDVNYIVTETVWKEMYYEPRFRPSLTQKRLLEAGFLGKKSGRGFFDYSQDNPFGEPLKDKSLGTKIFRRILVMLINEAADCVYLRIASAADIDTAMTKGVNYPKGLLKWADEIGIDSIMEGLESLMEFYNDDRYRVSPALKHMQARNTKFFS